MDLLSRFAIVIGMDLILGLLFLAAVDLFTPTATASTAYLVGTSKPYRNSLVLIAAHYVTWLVIGIAFFVLFGALWWGTVVTWYARDYLELAVGCILVGVGMFIHTPHFSLARFDRHLSLPKIFLAGIAISFMQLPSWITYVAGIALMHQHGVHFVSAVALLMGYCLAFILIPVVIVIVRAISGDNYNMAVNYVFKYVIDPFKHIFRLVVMIIGVMFVLHWVILHLGFGLHTRPDWNIPERPSKHMIEQQRTPVSAQ